MSNLLVLTIGQTDVQLVIGEARCELSKGKCAALHDEIEGRTDWELVDSPLSKLEPPVDSLPKNDFSLCTPKLDALLRYAADNGIALTHALILETRRDAQKVKSDPRFAGTILATRLKEHGITQIRPVTYLVNNERLEDRDQPRDAIIRREVVRRIDKAVRECLASTRPQRILIAATGGMPIVSNLVEEIVCLHAAPDRVELLEIADGAKAHVPTPDRAVSRQRLPEPTVSYQARRHALDLIENGNLLGAWGAVQHLHADEVERSWTRVVEWLACFAASMPMTEGCDIPVLTHRLMAVRAGIRVEFSLRAGDIPRAVHGTIAFFESALWDHLGARLTRHDDPKKRIYKPDSALSPNLIRSRKGEGSSDDRRKPFEVAEEGDGQCWYKVFDDDVCAIKLAKHYLNKSSLQELGQAVQNVRDLRNDVAHNEPTPQLMAEARRRMIAASLWSPEDKFVAQPIVKDVLKELGERQPDQLCIDLAATVRERLLAVD